MAGSETSPRPREETATVLLTEVERSHLWETMPDVAAAAMARHYDVVVSAMHDHGAARLSRVGEAGMLALFGSTASAATAALAVQRGLAAEEWPGGLAVRVRIGLCTGQVRDGDWLDRTEVAVQRGARVRDIAHGGQTLLSAATASLVADALPNGAWLADLGVHRLRDSLTRRCVRAAPR